MNATKKPELAIFSPLPPSKSGIADYCFEQLPFLANDWCITVVIDDKGPEPIKVEPKIKVLRLSQWKEDSARDANVLRLYHLGNNPDHEFVYREIHRHPGIVVLHDYVLHHLIAHMTLGVGDLEGYERLMEHDYGLEGCKMAHHRAKGIFSEYQQFLLPLNGTVLEHSLGVIVHSHDSLNKIRSRYPALPVVRIPHHYSPPKDKKFGSAALAKERLGMSKKSLIITSLGFITPPKQVELTLQALEKIRDALPPFEFWLVGEVCDSEALQKKIQDCGLSGLVKTTGYVKMENFYQYIEATDLLINLRYPCAGETSGTLIRSLGMGTCAIVFDYGPFADYPADVAIKLPLDTSQPNVLEAAIFKALKEKKFRQNIALRASLYIQGEHEISVCVAAYNKFIREASNRPKMSTNRIFSTYYRQPPGLSGGEAMGLVNKYIGWIEDKIYGVETRDYARTHARRWAKTLEFLPRPEAGMSALEMGSYQVISPVLRHHFGFQEVVGTDYDPNGRVMQQEREFWAHGKKELYKIFLFNAEADRYPFENDSFDLVMCCEVIEHLSVDPCFMISEINRILRIGGVLLLTTPNITSARGLLAMLEGYSPYLYPDFNRNRSPNRHNIEYSPHQISAILTAGGFEISRLETPNCWEDSPKEILEFLSRNKYPVHMRGDNIIALAHKKTDTIDRYPIDIYGPGETILRSSKLGPLPT